MRRLPIVWGVVTGLAATAVAANSESEITRAYRKDADRIIKSVLSGCDAEKKLWQLCDDVGNRISGSAALDKACQWAVQTLRSDGQENVHLEPARIPQWVRGKESVTLLAPRPMPMAMLGLGFSVGTPPEGITAPVIVVNDHDELTRIGSAAKGKIVLFNHAMPAYSPEKGTGYGATVQYRYNGARWAAEQGAVGCLVRSVTARSLRSPHTGGMGYQDAAVKIPSAAISIEDAELLARFQKRGVATTVRMKMDAVDHGMVDGNNVVAELRGSTNPDEIVVISGHLDSWDVGQGAQDDGGGCVMAMETLNVLRKLGLRPRRTIRVVLWTAEEVGLYGAKAYARDHADELARHVAAIEADSGSFQPVNYSLDCADQKKKERAAEQMRDVLALCSPVAPLTLKVGFAAADVGQMKPGGVVVMGHNSDSSHYFDYHHTHADTVDKIDPDELKRNVAVMAVVAYTIADLPQRLGESPTP